METHEIELSGGRIRYHEHGDGPPVVFVHGLLVDSGLWDAVLPRIAGAGFRCIEPDWPLGAHRIPVPRADLTPPGFAAMTAEFRQRMDLDDVTVVGSDTGGGLTQILMANHPERIGRVVLTPSDSFESFLPPMFAYLPTLARIPGAVDLLTAALRLRILHRLPMTFGWLSRRPLDTGRFLEPARRDAGVRDDLRRLLVGVHRRHTLAAVEGLRRFERPVLLAWAIEDRIFPISLAHRLAEVLPDASVVAIPDSYTFVPVDRPERLAELVVDFVRARTTS